MRSAFVALVAASSSCSEGDLNLYSKINVYCLAHVAGPPTKWALIQSNSLPAATTWRSPTLPYLTS